MSKKQLFLVVGISTLVAIYSSFKIGWHARAIYAPVKEEVVTKTVLISVLEEEQKCKEAGGVFHLWDTYDSNWEDPEDSSRIHMWCYVTQPPIEVFDYKID